MAKYLDKNGLLYLVTKLKSMFVSQVSGKGLSTNDYTTAEKNKLAGIAENANNYVHPAYTPQASGLYKVTVDATGHVSAVAAATKEDITALGIPGQDTTYAPATASANGLMSAADKSKLDGFGAADTYALKSDLSSVYKYKGSVASETDLPASGNTSGDVYNVEDTGMNYAWDGTAWDPLGGSFDLEAITNQEIDAILAS
jgi:hypothetical protein